MAKMAEGVKDFIFSPSKKNIKNWRPSSKTIEEWTRKKASGKSFASKTLREMRDMIIRSESLGCKNFADARMS